MRHEPRANRYRTIWSGEVRKDHVGQDLVLA